MCEILLKLIQGVGLDHGHTHTLKQTTVIFRYSKYCSFRSRIQLSPLSISPISQKKGRRRKSAKTKQSNYKKIDICVINHILLPEHDDFYRQRIRNGVEQLVAVKAPLLSHQLGRTISFSGNHATANGFPGGPAECCLWLLVCVCACLRENHALAGSSSNTYRLFLNSFVCTKHHLLQLLTSTERIMRFKICNCQ